MSSRTATVRRAVEVDGTTYSFVDTIDYDNEITSVVDLAPAKEGSLTTRTDVDTGTLTMDSGHGILTGDKICIFWDTDEDTGAVAGARSNVTVGTVASLSVPIDLGTGDDLPPATTPVRVMVFHSEVVSILDGVIDPVFIITTAGQRGFVVFAKTDGTPVLTTETEVDGGGAYVWTAESGAANPFDAADIGKVLTAHGDAENTVRLSASVGYLN